MAEVTIEIGGRAFEVSCQDGEEHFLKSAAVLLDNEASVLNDQIGRLPEARMLLMSGLMLADKTAGLSDELQSAQAQIEEMRARLETLENAPAPEPERMEVAVIPDSVQDSFAEIAARAEALAHQAEEKLAG